jgi:hypothetical protein
MNFVGVSFISQLLPCNFISVCSLSLRLNGSQKFYHCIFSLSEYLGVYLKDLSSVSFFNLI